jgi:hypothetical protein
MEDKTVVKVAIGVIGAILINLVAGYIGFVWFEHMVSDFKTGMHSKGFLEALFTGIISIFIIPFFITISFGIPLIIANLAYFTALGTYFGISYFNRKTTIERVIETTRADGTIVREVIIEEKRGANKGGCMKAIGIVAGIVLILFMLGSTTSWVRGCLRERKEKKEMEKLLEMNEKRTQHLPSVSITEYNLPNDFTEEITDFTVQSDSTLWVVGDFSQVAKSKNGTEQKVFEYSFGYPKIAVSGNQIYLFANKQLYQFAAKQMKKVVLPNNQLCTENTKSERSSMLVAGQQGRILGLQHCKERWDIFQQQKWSSIKQPRNLENVYICMAANEVYLIGRNEKTYHTEIYQYEAEKGQFEQLITLHLFHSNKLCIDAQKNIWFLPKEDSLVQLEATTQTIKATWYVEAPEKGISKKELSSTELPILIDEQDNKWILYQDALPEKIKQNSIEPAETREKDFLLVQITAQNEFKFFAINGLNKGENVKKMLVAGNQIWLLSDENKLYKGDILP